MSVPRKESIRLTPPGEVARAFRGLRWRLVANSAREALSGSRLRLAMIVFCCAIFWAGLFGLFFEGFRFIGGYIPLTNEIVVHELSRRSAANFQAVNCAALPDTLFESEIFGYEKGAFTGAHDRKPGRLELANDGTLFLDEIADMSLIAQAKLLRVLEERRFERLGGQKSISVDFRLISATNRPLEQFVRDGRFREDLYYRVNAFAIRLPSLRERQVDIPVLAQRFLARYCAAQGLPLDSKTFSREALDLLLDYPWPGNIRELESTVVARRAVGAGPRDPGRRHRVPARHDAVAAADRRPAAVAGRSRTRAHRPRARSGAVEQEGSGARARHQPRHAVSQDRRVPARARVAERTRARRDREVGPADSQDP